jgi:hypothetical protein
MACDVRVCVCVCVWMWMWNSDGYVCGGGGGGDRLIRWCWNGKKKIRPFGFAPRPPR